MKNTLCFCMKDISFSGFGELIIWIGTAILIVAAILALIKKPKQ